jgi:Zn-dependent protease with chaperone function
VVALPMANALADFAGKSIGVTDAAMATWSDEELAPVIGHEMAHLSEPWWAWAVRFSMLFVLAMLVALPSATPLLVNNLASHNFLVPTLLAGYCAVLGLFVFHRRVYRQMEVRADAMARQVESVPGAFARALEKGYQVNLVPVVVASRRHRYPELYERMVDAGVTPDYPRPAPPRPDSLYLGVLVVLASATFGAFCLALLARVLPG